MTTLEVNFIEANYGLMEDGEMAMILSKIMNRHITYRQVQRQREQLGFDKKTKRGEPKLKRVLPEAKPLGQSLPEQ